MSIDESTAKGLTKRFQREVEKGARRYNSRLSTLPKNARPKARIKLAESLMQAAGPAGAYVFEGEMGVYWGVWRHWDIESAGQGYMSHNFLWPNNSNSVHQMPIGRPCFITHHAVQRVAQSYLDTPKQFTELGPFLYKALLAVRSLHHTERDGGGSALTEEWGDCWLVNQEGCALISHNEHGARIVKTFIAASEWDDWRHRKWGRYLDGEYNTLIADHISGDILNVAYLGKRTDGVRVAREVARFNIEERGLNVSYR